MKFHEFPRIKGILAKSHSSERKILLRSPPHPFIDHKNVNNSENANEVGAKRSHLMNFNAKVKSIPRYFLKAIRYVKA